MKRCKKRWKWKYGEEYFSSSGFKSIRKSLYLSRHAGMLPFYRRFKTQMKRTIPLLVEIILSRNKGHRFRSHQRFSVTVQLKHFYLLTVLHKQHSCRRQNNAVLPKQSLFVSFRELFASFLRISFSLPVGLFFNLTRSDWFKTGRFLRIRPPFKE